MQLSKHYEDDKFFECIIPDELDEVMPGVFWGKANQPFTPAFWRFLCVTNGAIHETSRYHLGKTLEEEVIACLLGGHGITGEMGIAAFNHLNQHHVIQESYSAQKIENLLSEPIMVGSRSIHYRYPNQKAKYIAIALKFLRENEPTKNNNRELRNWLTSIPGIGLKTASWITRNWCDAEDVAILDIHIHRAGVIAGIYNASDDVSKNYLSMEEKFISLAQGIEIPANILDNQIWNEFRRAPLTAHQMLIERGVSSKDRCGLPAANHSSTSRNYDLFSSI